METASFNGFIKMIFYIILFYYIFKFLVKLFLPVLLKKVVQKAGENFQQQYQTNSNPFQGQSNQDEIIKNTSTNGNPKATKKVGEYIDYEELD